MPCSSKRVAQAGLDLDIVRTNALNAYNEDTPEGFPMNAVSPSPSGSVDMQGRKEDAGKSSEF